MTIKPTPTTYETIIADLASRVQGLEAAQPGPSLEVFDGTTDVNPTRELLISSGLFLTQPVIGVAEISAALSEVEQMTAATTITVTSGNSGFATFAHDAGATLLDYSTTFAPSFLADGVYSVVVFVQLGQTINPGQACQLFLQIPLSGFTGGPSVEDNRVGLTSLGTSANTRLSGSLTVAASAGDYISAELTNLDTISHTFHVTVVSFVTKIG